MARSWVSLIVSGLCTVFNSTPESPSPRKADTTFLANFLDLAGVTRPALA